MFKTIDPTNNEMWKINHILIRILEEAERLFVLKLKLLLDEKDSLPIYIVIKNQWVVDACQFQAPKH